MQARRAHDLDNTDNLEDTGTESHDVRHFELDEPESEREPEGPDKPLEFRLEPENSDWT